MDQEPFFRDFYYPKSPALKPSQILFRRLKQTSQILFSDSFVSNREIKTSMEEHYSHEKEIHFYSQYARFGLHENELEAIQVLQSKPHWEPGKILVVGCGTGRESFFFADQFNKAEILGIDLSEKMIKAARSLNSFSNLTFAKVNIENIKDEFDFIWISPIIESHIQGLENRIHFFESIYNLCSTQAKIVITPQIKKLHWQSIYFWSSMLLRLRWLGRKQWEPGDVLLANLGAHRKVEKLVFSHFYPSKEHFMTELKIAGFEKMVELPEESWIISK